MARNTLKRRPEKFEDIKGIGEKRAKTLREEFGSYEQLKNRGGNAVRNKLAGVVSGDRRNLPKYAENILRAGKRESEAVQAVDDSLVQTVSQGADAPTRSKTQIAERSTEDDRFDLGFSTQERPDEDFEAAFDIFREEYDDRFDVPANELGRFGRTENDRATVQPLIGAATSRVTFARGAQPDDLRSEIESSAERVSKKRAVQSPGELTDAFTGFVENQFGFTQSFGDFDIDRREYNRAQEFQSERSPKARRVDAARRAPVTDEITTWKSDPSHYDYPGIDTPTEEPELQPGDLGTDEMFDGVDDALDGMDEAAGGLF